jgi:hypothetical protein
MKKAPSAGAWFRMLRFSDASRPAHLVMDVRMRYAKEAARCGHAACLHGDGSRSKPDAAKKRDGSP